MDDQQEVEKELEKLSTYRNTVVGQILADEKEYHTTITYIAAGGLALFLTINEKFFTVIDALYSWAFIISLCLLFITLVLYVVNIVSDISAHEQLRDEADKMLQAKNYDKPALLTKWNDLIGRSRWLTYLRMFTLAGGILLEILFIAGNMFSEKSTTEKEPTIEIKWRADDSAKLRIDTIGHQLQIQLDHP